MALKRALRLRSSRDFQRVRQHGRSVSSRLLILAWNANNLDSSRVGFIVSKRVSKLAVTRNRLKRLLGEAVRPLLASLPPGYDLVLSARQQAAGPAVRLDTLAHDITFLLRRARLLEAVPGPDARQ